METGLRVQDETLEWTVDSGCTRHMSNDPSDFLDLISHSDSSRCTNAMRTDMMSCSARAPAAGLSSRLVRQSRSWNVVAHSYSIQASRVVRKRSLHELRRSWMPCGMHD